MFQYTRSNMPKRVTSWRDSCPASLRPRNTVRFEEMSLRWRAVGNTVLDLTGRNFNLRPPASQANVLPLNQLACILYNKENKTIPVLNTKWWFSVGHSKTRIQKDTVNPTSGQCSSVFHQHTSAVVDTSLDSLQA